MQQRINVSLPEETVKLIDRVTRKGNRSRLIDAAVRHYVRSVGRAKLQDQLAEGYRKLAKSSLETAAEWFPLDEEAWRKAGV
jgi:CopG family transcriptional regulator/antitoxin EndoAI